MYFDNLAWPTNNKGRTLQWKHKSQCHKVSRLGPSKHGGHRRHCGVTNNNIMKIIPHYNIECMGLHPLWSPMGGCQSPPPIWETKYSSCMHGGIEHRRLSIRCSHMLVICSTLLWKHGGFVFHCWDWGTAALQESGGKGIAVCIKQYSDLFYVYHSCAGSFVPIQFLLSYLWCHSQCHNFIEQLFSG